MTKEEFEHLVLDSGPLIYNTFPTTAKNYVTVPEVLAEIKDEATRLRVSQLIHTLPLKIRSPSPAAFKQVKEMATTTGDISTLSSVDLKVIALTLTLEWECNNGDYVPSLKEATVDEKVKESEQVEELPKEETLETTPSALDKDDEDGEWITPENVKTFIAKDALRNVSLIIPKKDNNERVDQQVKYQVGCVSNDFALQNVLLQLKLGLFSPEGYRIKQIKNWLLRCHACFWTTRQMDRRFCDRCGGPTLLRTSFGVDHKGEVKLFLRQDYQYKLHGTKAPLPTPKGGRNGNSMLLREDQKEYQQAMQRYHRGEKKAAKIADDWNAVDDRLATVFGGMDLKGTGNSTKTDLNDPSLPQIGFGKRNPNRSRRRV